MSAYFKSDGKPAPCDLAPGLFTGLLPNGLKVLIRQDNRLPVAICNIWVKVGSNLEPEKLRGWSHGIEHMLFKGTAGREEGDFAREVAAAGGTTNAGTGYETTNYHITVPVNELPVAVDILADALFESSFAAEALDAERQVLVHENHMYDDIPFGFGVTWRWGMELAFDRSPYAQPIGGRDENLLDRDRDDILNFWHSAYRPDNMTVVVVGDVDPQDTFDLLLVKLGQKTAAAVDEDPELCVVATPPVEYPHDACRLRVEKGDIQRAYAKLVFPCPGEQSGLDPVLSVTRRVLADGRSCRLHRQVLEDRKLVDDFAFMTETGPREGAILVDMETDPERLPQALQAICAVLKKLGDDGCTVTELERARVRVKRSFLFGEETIQGQAGTLGYHETIDDLPGAFQFSQRVDAVTSEQVAAFCRSVFRLPNLSCVIYLPNGCDPAATGLPTDVAQLAALLAGHLDAGPAPDPATLSIPRITGTRSGSRTGRPDPEELPFTQVDLGEGTLVYLRQDDTLPIFSMALTVKGGSTTESATNAGLATLMQMVMVKGAAGLAAEALHEALEGDGANLGPTAERDYGGLVLGGLSDHMARPLELLGTIMCHPTFSDTEITQERRLALEQLAALADNPFQAAAVRLREMMYGDHPYGRPLPGSETSLPGLTREDLQRRHGQVWTRDNLQIVISGHFRRDELLSRLETALADLPVTGDGTPPLVKPGPTRTPDGIETHRIARQQNQSVVLVAWPGPYTVEEDRVPLILLKEILNGQSGRLFESLRNRRSLCYNTGTLSTAGYGQGMFLGYVLTEPAKEDEARRVLVEELANMGLQDVDAAEFKRARAKLLGNLLISSQSNGAQVGRTARDLVFDRPPNDLARLITSIMQCEPAHVRQVAARLLTPDQRFQVTIGP